MRGITKNVAWPGWRLVRKNALKLQAAHGPQRVVERRYAVPLFVALIAAGLAGNVFPFSILNADFIFGSIFAMLALQIFGFWWGVLAAAVIAGYTYLAWNHPWAVLTMTAEAAAVGLLMARRRVHMVTADAFYWLVIAIPTGYLCFTTISHLSPSGAMFLMVKQAINGITNALTARLLFTAYLVRSKTIAVSFREVLSTVLAFFVLVPAIILLAVAGKADFADTDRRIREVLRRENLHATDNLRWWIEDRKMAIEGLARMAGHYGPQQMQWRLDQARATGANFLRIALLDVNAVLTAMSPLTGELGQPSIGMSFADQPYIPDLRKEQKSILSEVVMARVDVSKPVVAVLAPVVVGNAYRGYVAGILSLDRVRRIIEATLDEEHMFYALLDRNGNTIVSNRRDQSAMTPFVRREGTMSPLEGGVARWTPPLPPNASTIDLWGKSHYVVESPLGGPAEWRLILEQPVAPFQKRLYDSYTGRLFLLFAILCLSLALAEFLSRRMVRTTELLGDITHDLPEKLTSGGSIAWPRSVVLETRRLVANFMEMADSLTAQYARIREMNESLRVEVKEKTEANRRLQAANKELEAFSYSVSHDLKAPLRAISGFAQIIARRHRDALNEEAQHYVDNVVLASERMAVLINELLEYSRIGRIAVRLEPVPLPAVMEQVLDILSQRVSEARADVSVPSPLPAVMGDMGLLRQAFTNLLDNAIKFRGKDTPPEIRVEVRDEGGMLSCSSVITASVSPRSMPRRCLLCSRGSTARTSIRERE